MPHDSSLHNALLALNSVDFARCILSNPQNPQPIAAASLPPNESPCPPPLRRIHANSLPVLFENYPRPLEETCSRFRWRHLDSVSIGFLCALQGSWGPEKDFGALHLLCEIGIPTTMSA